jgi:hypothetical protein
MAIVALGVPVYVVAARFGGRLDEAPAGVTADAYSLRASEDP